MPWRDPGEINGDSITVDFNHPAGPWVTVHFDIEVLKSIRHWRRNMQILLANPRGFCAGVDRAISIVENALAIYGRTDICPSRSGT